jgi:hypothetical protein
MTYWHPLQTRRSSDDAQPAAEHGRASSGAALALCAPDSGSTLGVTAKEYDTFAVQRQKTPRPCIQASDHVLGQLR